jgi:site-specific DNA recombinase
MESADRRKDENADLAVKVFELSQDLRQKWFTSGFAEKRRLLNFVCLNLNDLARLV